VDGYPLDSMHSKNMAFCLLCDCPAMKPMPDPEKPQMNGQGTKRWLIVVARGQADLYAHLVQAFSRDGKVRVILDRRKDDSRNSPQVTHRLRTHGAVIIRQAP
jgi:hypothetical protein